MFFPLRPATLGSGFYRGIFCAVFRSFLADGCTMNLGESTYPLNDPSVYVLNGGNAATNVSYEKFSITIHGQASGTGKLNIYYTFGGPTIRY